MSHEFESGLCGQHPAWHKLGTVGQEAPNIKEGIRLAGLAWDVVQHPIYVKTPSQYEWSSPDRVKLPEWKALLRSTDQKPLSVVGKGYTPLQNSAAFAFFDPFLQDGDATLEAAGSLRGGKTIWVMAKLRHTPTEVGADDYVEPYLLLSNSHDGTQAVRVALPSFAWCVQTR